MVAIAFIENIEKKSDVNHKNKNKLNNHISNSEWMTRRENNIHRSDRLIITSNRKIPVLHLFTFQTLIFI